MITGVVAGSPSKIAEAAVMIWSLVNPALAAEDGFTLNTTAGPLVLWTAPAWTRYITDALMLPACIFFAAAYLPGSIKLALKHPMLVGVKLWAFGHLLVNGDLGSIILFGSILGWAVYDRISLKYRSDPGAPPIPIGGRTSDSIAIIVGTIV